MAKAKVLSQMESGNSSHLASVREMRIKSRREQSAGEQVATFNSVACPISLILLSLAILMIIQNQETVRPLWEKIAQYVIF